LHDGQTVAGWVYAPTQARLAVAELGSGALINGSRIRLPRGDEEATAPGMVYTRFLPAEVACKTRRELVLPTGAASADYPAILQGTLSFVLYWRTLSWDHAAGTLLVTEAGGKAAHLDGAAYWPHLAKEGLLAASTASDWAAIRSCITGPV
jgi:fructose-1,6-bisphosphatase/inositol monophosphatase family enzyme